MIHILRILPSLSLTRSLLAIGVFFFFFFLSKSNCMEGFDYFVHVVHTSFFFFFFPCSLAYVYFSMWYHIQDDMIPF